MIAIGIMSGTSGDGADAAAIELDVPTTHVRVLATASAPYPEAIRDAVLALGEGRATDTREIARLHAALGDQYAALAARVAGGLPDRADVVAVHGQTVAHLPGGRVTLQIGDAARVAHRTGIATVSDLRSADVAAGGQGAPLVPFADLILFGSLAPVAVLNVGGIANLTVIPTADPDAVVAFDTGPGNMVIDAVAALDGRTHDADGAGARRGRVDERALSELLAHPYFARRAPKSTGREEFGGMFARRLAEIVTRHGGSHDDALATATALTARTIAAALRREASRHIGHVLVAGGGARNPALLAMLHEALAPDVHTVEPTGAHGVPPAYREAVAFAILGAYRLRGLPNTLPRATGAARAVSGGALHLP
ncbi:MAG TPA: anhydro-N-acetylmuramic acid kinase [Candidatus Limnocylindria bacterium]|nr:anhydro-N-acetylmuramic acid kinase [Candidatus Limnocylindria bacterium]